MSRRNRQVVKEDPPAGLLVFRLRAGFLTVLSFVSMLPGPGEEEQDDGAGVGERLDVGEGRVFVATALNPASSN